MATFVKHFEDCGVPNQSNSISVSVYHASNLVNWELEGRVCHPVLAVSLCHTSLSGDIYIYICIDFKNKETVLLLSNHNRSLRRQSGVHCCTCAWQRGADDEQKVHALLATAKLKY